jgi:pyruvate, water dikinase
MMFVRWFRDVTADDVGSVGGKNASLGEMLRALPPLGVRVPDGFAARRASSAASAASRSTSWPRVERCIDSISLNPDALARTTLRVLEVERRLQKAAG